MINIIKRIFDKNSPPILIAEISANHNGSIKTAKKLIMTAKKNGADIVKLQTYEPKNMTINCSKKDFLILKNIISNNTCLKTPYTRFFLYTNTLFFNRLDNHFHSYA